MSKIIELIKSAKEESYQLGYEAAVNEIMSELGGTKKAAAKKAAKDSPKRMANGRFAPTKKSKKVSKKARFVDPDLEEARNM